MSDELELNMTNYFNKKYKEIGFYKMLDEIEAKLEYGHVTKKDDGLYCITTGGWSEDEQLIDDLIHFSSVFGYNHYVGYLRGGAYYFAFRNDDNFEIIQKL